MGAKMKRGYIILFSGVACFTIGVAIFVVFAELRAATDPFMQDNTVLNSTIGPNQSLKISSRGTNTQSNFSVIVDAKPSDIIFRSEIRDPKGKIVSSNEFRDQFFDSFKPEYVGEYLTTVTNKGIVSANIDAIFNQVPMISENDESRLNLLKGILTGIILVIMGLPIIVGGGVVLIIDKRKSRRASSRSLS
jgi:hypothetical protein